MLKAGFTLNLITPAKDAKGASKGTISKKKRRVRNEKSIICGKSFNEGCVW